MMIFGNKYFEIKNVRNSGDFTRFYHENPNLVQGTSIEQRLRLRITGEITDGIGINATFDDTKVQDDNHEITLFLEGKKLEGALGDIETSYNKSEYIFYNKKTRGIEIKDVDDKLYFLYAKSEGEIYSEVFTGKGVLQEYMLKFYPVVKGSERVYIDGVLLERGTDFDIDYDFGSIILDNSILPVESSSRIYVNYEYEEDEKAFNRYLAGFSYEDYIWDKNILLHLNYFQDYDDKKKLVDDPEDSLKPSGYRVWSYGINYEKDNFLLEFENAFGKKDNNLLSDKEKLDKPVHSELKALTLEYKGTDLTLQTKNRKRKPGYEIIGKQESEVVSDESFSELTYSHLNTSLSYSISETDSLIYNDPFLEIKGEEGITFNRNNEEFTYSTGTSLKLSGFFKKNDRISQEGVEYDGDDKSMRLNFNDNNKNYFFNFHLNELENITDSNLIKDMEKKELGVNFRENNAEYEYVYSDILDKGEKIKGHDLNLQIFSNKMNTYIYLNQREEEKVKNIVGDVNISYKINDNIDFQGRYNSSNLLQIKEIDSDTQEINTVNEMYNYKFDYINDFLNISFFSNMRERKDKTRNIRQSRNFIDNFMFNYSDSSSMNYRFTRNFLKNVSFEEDITNIDEKNKFDIIRNLDQNSNGVLSFERNEKESSNKSESNYIEKTTGLSYNRSGSKFSFNFGLKKGEKKYKTRDNINFFTFGDEIIYNMDNRTNIKYEYNYTKEKKQKKLSYMEDELSFNRTLNSQTMINFYIRRKDVPADNDGKAYESRVSGFTFDTNF
ncbi:MAG: hypothetical protein ACQESP_05575 [Candidatus Muiribacteriota bacterium]